MTDARLPKTSAAMVEMTEGAPEALAALGLGPEDLAEVEGLSYADLESLGLDAEAAAALAGLTVEVVELAEAEVPALAREPEAVEPPQAETVEAAPATLSAPVEPAPLTDRALPPPAAEVASAPESGPEAEVLRAAARKAAAVRVVLIVTAVTVAGAVGWHLWRRHQARKGAPRPRPAKGARRPGTAPRAPRLPDLDQPAPDMPAGPPRMASGLSDLAAPMPRPWSI
jgi:hypothetical protein